MKRIITIILLLSAISYSDTIERRDKTGKIIEIINVDKDKGKITTRTPSGAIKSTTTKSGNTLTQKDNSGKTISTGRINGNKK